MIAKQPVCYDFSHWRTIPDFSKLVPFPMLVITKATEGTSYRDETFLDYMAQMKVNGIYRGAFHFHRKGVSASAQATNFIGYTKGILTDRDIIVLDVEEGGETATQLIAWFQLIEAQYPRNPLWIYSRKNILDAISMTQNQKDYFRSRVKTWTAGYPSNPDLYNSVPSFYVPDQTKYGPVIAWQYTDRLPVAGVVQGSADANWMSPDLVISLGNTQPPPSGGDMKKYRVVWPNGVSRRTAPTTSNSSTTLPPYSYDAVVDVLQDGIADQTYPTDANKRWVKFADGHYGASDYPDGSGPKVRMIDVTPVEPPPPAETPTIEIVYNPSEVTVVLKPQ